MHARFLLLIWIATLVRSDESPPPTTPQPTLSNKTLVLISFDGFRYDTLNSTIAPNISAWAQGGVVYKNGVQSQAVTFTAPNHYSIVTGLYEDAHGIVGNIFYDTKRKEFYDIYNLAGMSGSVQRGQMPHWYTSKTIWQANGAAGGKSAVIHWPIGDVASGDTNDTTYVAWHDHGDISKWQEEVELVLTALQNGNNLIAWYVSEPDHTLHTHGFYHEGHYRKIMADLDNTFGYFLHRMRELDLFDTTDIILTADHGHAEIESLDAVLCMDKYISGFIGFSYQVSDHTIVADNDKQAKEIFDQLTAAVRENNIKVRVMWTKDVPKSWHFSHPSRLGQVMVVPEIGADARFMCPWTNASDFHSSTHGHAPDEAEMRALLVMRGPSFKENTTITSIPQNIDLFPLMCEILGIPVPSNNGTIDRVQRSLRSYIGSGSYSMDPTIKLALIAMPIIVLSIMIYYIVQRIRQGPNKELANLIAAATDPLL